MSKRLMSLLILLLTACVDTGSQPYFDPYTAKGYADGAIQATEAARYDRSMQATYTQADFERRATGTAMVDQQQAQATQNAMLSTQTAIADYSTQQAANYQASATASAVALNVRRTDTAWKATSAAIDIAITARVEKERRDQLQKDVTNGIWLLLKITLSIALGWAAFQVARKLPGWIENWQSWLLEWMDRKNSVRRSPYGMIAWQDWDDNGRITPRLMATIDQQAQPQLSAPRRPIMHLEDEGEFQDIPEIKNISRSVVEYPTGNRERSILRSNALKLVKLSIAAYGSNSARIMPAHDLETEMGNQTWQDIINSLKYAGCVTTSTAGTTVTEQHGRRLDELLYDIQSPDKIKLVKPPTPPPPVPAGQVEQVRIQENALEYAG